jgi:hypothetical protein
MHQPARWEAKAVEVTLSSEMPGEDQAVPIPSRLEIDVIRADSHIHR